MLTKKRLLFPLIAIAFSAFSKKSTLEFKGDERFIVHLVDPQKGRLKMFWKSPEDSIFGNFNALKSSLQRGGDTLLFAMNGGMYKMDQSPQGLYIENGKVLSPVDTVQEAYGNFYMQPNGVFFVRKNGQAGVVPTTSFVHDSSVNYATQSGPMLLVDSVIHPRFIEGSKNLHIRNGVGLLPDGRLLFVISRVRVNFYDFASYFRSKACANALYLDGAVSKMYLPSQLTYGDGGRFGVIIGEVK